MKILIIDNTIDRDSWGSPELARFGKLVPGATIHVRRAPERDLPRNASGFDRVILSGSKTPATDSAPWINDLLDFVVSTIEAGTPYLGVCYGHQILVRALGGQEAVQKAALPEFGWSKIELIGSSPLFESLPRSFYSFSSHFDEVARLPMGFDHLAKSEACDIQACQLTGKPVYGIQFHPEKNLAEAEKTLVHRKKLGSPRQLLHSGKGKELYNAAIGETIFGNFLKNP